MLAREFGQKSRLGAYLNELCDVVSDAALYAPFALVAPFGVWSVAVVIFLSALSEFAGVLGPTVGASRRYDGPMGKSDRALVFGALGFWIGIGAPLPHWLSWLMRADLLSSRHHHRQPGARRPGRENGGLIMHRRRFGSCMRAVEEKTFNTHDGVELFYRYWPAVSQPPKGAIVLFHRGHEHSGRMGHLADELDLPEFAVFAWDARGHGRSSGRARLQPEPRHVGARRADLHRSHRRDLRHSARADCGHRAKRRCGAGLDLGARLRAEDPLHGVGVASLQGEALRAVCALRPQAATQAASETSSSIPTSKRNSSPTIRSGSPRTGPIR